MVRGEIYPGADHRFVHVIPVFRYGLLHRIPVPANPEVIPSPSRAMAARNIEQNRALA